MAPKTRVKGKTKPKPITRTRDNPSPAEFRDVYMGACRHAAALPYMATGGRRADLAVNCKKWVPKEGPMKMTKVAMTRGFLAIHATKIADKETYTEWNVTDAVAQSWANQMADKLANLNRHINQAMLQDPRPQWLNLVFADDDVEDKSEDNTIEAQEEEEEAEGDEGSGEEEQQEDDPCEEDFFADFEEKEAVTDEHTADVSSQQLQHVDEKGWNAAVNQVSGKAYRTAIGDKKLRKHYAKSIIPPDENTPRLSPVWAEWEDGSKCCIPNVTYDTMFPDFFVNDQLKNGAKKETSKLPPRGKKKGAKQGSNILWEGTSSTKEKMRVLWRDSRGWGVSLFIDSKQKCQIKVEAFECTPDKQIQRQCEQLMISVAEQYAMGEIKIEELFSFRDKNMHKYGISESAAAATGKSKKDAAIPKAPPKRSAESAEDHESNKKPKNRRLF